MSEKKKTLVGHITTEADFQYAINIGYDLYSNDKIKNYIPTTSAIELTEDIMLSLNSTSNDRARIFVGAYGKGKSHLVLMLVSLLHRKEISLFDTLLNKVMEYNPDLYNYISEYINSDKRLLPVIIQGGNMGIKQSLLFELKKSLERAELGDVMPNTYFKAAVATIQNWQTEYESTYKAFESKIDISINDFIAELSEFNPSYYNRFIELYPSLTSGSEFNPVDSLDVIDLYNDVIEKIKTRGYNGIFVVYDEFSKFLEGSLHKTSANEVKLLQDFAEMCTRSKSNQLHILLISHKGILNYIDKLPKNKVDAWKAVSNRFKSVELNNSSNQIYEVISHVIKHDEDWFNNFITENKSIFDDIFIKWRKNKAFAELTDEEISNVVYGCYPLEPVTTFLLPRISEKIAQNERTLFTYLSSPSQKATLHHFLNNATGQMPLVTPDYIYDYFEPLFKAENYNTDTHRLWKTTTTALNKLSADLIVERKIIKAIALVYILNQFEILPPDMQMLIDVYNGSVYDMEIVVKAITYLENTGLIKKLDNKNYLRITEHTDVNIDELIENTIAKRSSQTNVKSILNEYVGDKTLYPTGYNDEHEITRYFDFEFITYDEILAIDDWDKKIQGKASDGVVYAVITDDENDLEDICKTIHNVKHSRIVFIVPKAGVDVYGAVLKYDAIRYIISTSSDTVLIDELTYSFDDLSELLDEYIDIYLRPELASAKYFYNRQERSISRRSRLTGLLSDICAAVYPNSPIINNEVINKTTLSPTAMNSRCKVVTGLLENKVKPDLGLTGTGQDVSFMRSTVKNTNILTIVDDTPVLIIDNLPDRRLQDVLEIIRTYFLRSSQEGRMSFKELYDVLMLPQYGIGLKKGIIPIYIAVILHFYKRYAVILSNRRELEITAKLLESINEKPENYEIYLENWNEKKEQYINSLEKLFSKYVNEYEKEYNNFEYIVKAMQRWFMQLPKYTKEIERSYSGNKQLNEIEPCTLKLKNSLRQPELNPREFLFEKLLWIYGYEEFKLDIVKNIETSKQLLDESKAKLVEILAQEVRTLFVTKQHKKEASLYSVIKDWCESLNNKVITHLFNNGEEKLLNLCVNITPDEKKFIEDMSRVSVGLRIDDWSENTFKNFLSIVSDFKEVIKAQNEKMNSAKGQASDFGVYKITYVDETGNETIKTFNKTDYSSQAKLLYNDALAMLEEYGESLSHNEKRQVLVDIINKILG